MSTSASRITSPKTQRWLLWLGGFVLAAGIAAVLIVFLRDTGTKTPEVFTPGAPSVVKVPKKVALEPEVRTVAANFILTAVQRKNLDKAWPLAGPAIRQDMTYKEWLKGDIPVVPFLGGVGRVPLKVDLSTKNYALLEVILLPTKKGTKSEIFDIELIKVGKGAKAHWVVNSWVPRSHPTIPTNQSS